MDIVRSRAFGLTLVWIFFACAAVGTYILSKNIESRGNTTASVFMATESIHEVHLFNNKLIPDKVYLHPGDELLFVIKDESIHNIAEDRSRRNEARLESGEFSGKETYSLVFQNKGMMSFYDRLNQDLRLSVFIE